MTYRRVADHMTRSAESTGSSESAAVAAAHMRSHEILHLPVVDQGVVRGVLHERDLALVQSLKDVSLSQFTVAELMNHSVYPVTPNAPLAYVMRSMARHDDACAVVLQQGSVCGVLSLSEALRAATEASLEQSAPQEQHVDPDAARDVVLTEHAHVHAVLVRAHTAAQRLNENASDQNFAGAHVCARRLLGAMRSLLALEDTVLAPALAQLPGFGAERVRQLFEAHKRQTRETESVITALTDPQASRAELAERLGRLLSNLRRALAHEEQLLLDGDVLGSVGASTNVEAG